mmetsp:Transcript_85627/g.169950  ORF Transcript_85627/g.169950 Transcript_85627/m.169950 type:complete len:392 (+) Transcript_85627:70-1245(+)|eukprot:CAMPEP_0172667382 /NCGR_PEP_ID=MMETSP1074-20121228/8382_1 /TAXON_ID=2916 /ORGANISM="Ceratium fusus, Strain PA161109" /LENGTH=391 /DNA_ID=CAMNT_0013483873 /DNA_START=52 /DNA_END=1227 /DNA_ORIENTATION=-
MTAALQFERAWFIMLAGCVPATLGWWDNGHMLVAEVARQQLDAAEVDKLNELFREWEHDYPGACDVTTVAVWPDMIKCTQVSSYCAKPLSDALGQFDSWHFSDKPYNPDNVPLSDIQTSLYDKNPSAQWVLASAMNTFNKSRSRFAFNMMLRFVIHIVGDVHQPLHNVEGFFNDKAIPHLDHGDVGGNLIHVANVSFAKNLHAFWDAAAGLYLTNWPYSTADTALLEQNASELLKAHPPASFPSYNATELRPCWNDGGRQDCKDVFQRWASEAYDLAVKDAYQHISQGGTPSEAYVLNAQHLSQRQITLGGRRLGDLLKAVAARLPPAQSNGPEKANEAGVFRMRIGLAVLISLNVMLVVAVITLVLRLRRISVAGRANRNTALLTVAAGA